MVVHVGVIAKPNLLFPNSRLFVNAAKMYIDNIAKIHQPPVIRNFPISGLLEQTMPSGQPLYEQILYQASFDDHQLLDDRLGILDGIVHRGKNRGNLVLFWNRRYPDFKIIKDACRYALSPRCAHHPRYGVRSKCRVLRQVVHVLGQGKVGPRTENDEFSRSRSYFSCRKTVNQASLSVLGTGSDSCKQCVSVCESRAARRNGFDATWTDVAGLSGQRSHVNERRKSPPCDHASWIYLDGVRERQFPPTSRNPLGRRRGFLAVL